MDPQRRSFLQGVRIQGNPTASVTVHNLQTTPSTVSLPPPDPDMLLLNRCSFGISRQMVRQIRRQGRNRWLQQQLSPGKTDEAELEEWLREQTPTIYMSEQELAELDQGFRAANQLKQATLFRALYSRHQLYEVMVEFWSNHFSIYHRDGAVALLKTIDDREVIRRHALGRFRDLLHASSKSPAMLLYLDNHSNIAGTPNENYARELMELHTLGVGGGYTETDVREVARCFTGWALGHRKSPDAGRFRFYPSRHDQGSKTVLGTHIPAGGGIRDGEQVIDMLASHPSTARFISFKLARHFVSDAPPESLVQRMTRLFLDTDGNIPSLLEEMLLSREFMDSPDNKLRRPLDFIIGALRVTAASLQRKSYPGLRDHLYALGQVPFEWVPPDGYPDTADYWTSTSGMLNRWNFSSALAGSRLPGTELDYLELAGPRRTPEAIVDRLAETLLHRPLTDAHRQNFINLLADTDRQQDTLDDHEVEERLPLLIGLMLSSPYFQYR